MPLQSLMQILTVAYLEGGQKKKLNFWNYVKATPKKAA